MRSRDQSRQYAHPVARPMLTNTAAQRRQRSNLPMTEILHTLASTAHLIGVVLGVGTATVSDLLFFRFLRDGHISPREAQMLQALHPLLWSALGMLFVSGAFLVAQDPSGYFALPKFQLKLIVVVVIALNGVLLHYVVSPRLRRIHFGPSRSHRRADELHRIRRIAFSCGAVSITSWYTAVFLGMLRTIPVSLPLGVTLYGFLLTVAIAVAIRTERRMQRRAIDSASV